MLCAVIILPLIIIISITGMMFSTRAPVAGLMPYIIASIILDLIPFAYAVLLLKKWHELLSGKMQKAVYIIIMFMGFIMTFVVFTLEIYKF